MNESTNIQMFSAMQAENSENRSRIEELESELADKLSELQNVRFQRI
jgi:ribosomal protein L29